MPLVEQLLEEGLAPLVRPVAVAVMARMARLVRPGTCLRPLARPRLDNRRRIFLDDLVEFAPVEPDSAAGWTIVDFNALPLRHDERGLVDGTKIGMGHAIAPQLECSNRAVGEIQESWTITRTGTELTRCGPTSRRIAVRGARSRPANLGMSAKQSSRQRAGTAGSGGGMKGLGPIAGRAVA